MFVIKKLFYIFTFTSTKRELNKKHTLLTACAKRKLNSYIHVMTLQGCPLSTARIPAFFFFC